jgi:hypothetical protein
MKTKLAALALSLVATIAHADGGGPRPAPVGGAYLARYDGSIVSVANGPGGTFITYVQPRPSLITTARIGNGVLLARGVWKGRGFIGEAFVHSSICGAVPYAVTGFVDAVGVLVLMGTAPRFDNPYCQPRPIEMVLRFEPLARPPASPPRAPAPPPVEPPPPPPEQPA